MKNFDNYYDGVSMLLDKIADKLDPDFPNGRPENYSDSVVESLERIADNFDPSGGGLPAVTSSDNGKSLVVEDGEWSVDEILNGIPQVWYYSGYLYKTGSSTSVSNRYTAAEFKALLEDHTFAWDIHSIYLDDDVEVPCFTLYYKYSDIQARGVILPYNGSTKYTTSGTYITLSGTGYARYYTTPSVYEIPSGGSGGSVLTISEYSGTSSTEATTAIQNGSLIRFDSYGVYYPCLSCVVNYDEATSVTLQCGPFLITLYEDPSYNSYNNVGWPSNDGSEGGFGD